jgi:hypothetical protein
VDPKESSAQESPVKVHPLHPPPPSSLPSFRHCLPWGWWWQNEPWKRG